MTRGAKKTAVRHPASSIHVEERLAARHIDYRFEPNYSIDDIVDAEGHQVRLIEHRAPSEMVNRYAQQMKAGAVFPAVVVNERGELIDGNTRRRAVAKLGLPSIPAYICRDLRPIEARALSIELNQANGLPMDQHELRAYVRSAVQEGQRLDTKACARITGVRPSTLERWKAQAHFEQRAKRAGVSAAAMAVLSESSQAALNGIRLIPVLGPATSLAAAARMSCTEIRRLVTRINAATSEGDALTVVSSEREARGESIRAVASGFGARRRNGRSAMHIASLLRIDIDDLLDVATEDRAQTVQRLKDLRDYASQALEAAASRWSVDGSGDEHPSATLDLCALGGSHG